MARAGRKRKIDVDRTPAGRAKIDMSPSPSLVKRMVLSSLMGFAEPVFGTIPGIYYLSQRINADEFEAAKKFAALYAQYLSAVGGPKPPASPAMERGAAPSKIDVDTEAGAREAERHLDVMKRFHDAHNALRNAGRGVEDEVIRFCEGQGQTPNGHEGMLRIKVGLSALTILWKVRSK